MSDYEDNTQRGRTGRDRAATEQVLAEGEYAYIQDTTKGVTQVKTGPAVVNLQGQDRPVIYNPRTRRYDVVSLADAGQLNVLVRKGDYAILNNPADTGRHPTKGNTEAATDLAMGERIHIAGPASIALWPGQTAEVIDGHHLRLNQYLIARVYDEKAARKNWSEATVQTTVTPSGSSQLDADGEPIEVSAAIVTEDIPENLTVGRQLIIRGTDVSFFIPPTGVEVVQEELSGEYVREALTLERLQYCILIDESGNKRYIQGPDVVFPKPTEKFLRSDKVRVFKPIELSGKIQGIHIKVIQDYTDTDGVHGKSGKAYTEGDELFINGDDCAIYFPCEQHSVIRYDGKSRHYATAIQPGEGRYVLDRFEGAIRTVEGGDAGSMILPDPRNEVFVRRVLTDAECSLMYPKNDEVLAYNRALRNLQARTPTTRSGYVSEGELTRGAGRRKGGKQLSKGLSLHDGFLETMGSDYAAEAVGSAHFGNSSPAAASHEAVQDQFSRQSTYTQPREVTLGANKFVGIPTIAPWTGYAVLVVDPAGNRRVVEGPRRVLLSFDETLESLALSTGKPKTTDNLLKTSYLQVSNNKVSDLFVVETSDHVEVRLKLSIRVNFQGEAPEEKIKWFAVTNYVKLLCDHVRSVLKGTVRSYTIDEFYSKSTELIRDIVLGGKTEEGRKGMSFDENGMEVYDVEVLDVSILDDTIRSMVTAAQREVVQTNISLATARRNLEVAREQERIVQERATAQAETKAHTAKLAIDEIARNLSLAIERIGAQIQESEENQKVHVANLDMKLRDITAQVERDELVSASVLLREKATQDLALDTLKAETKARIDTLKASQEGFAEALVALDNKDTLVKVAEAMSVGAALTDENAREYLNNALKGTPLAAILAEVNDKASVPKNGARTQVSG